MSLTKLEIVVAQLVRSWIAAHVAMDLTRLPPTSIEVNHDGRIIHDAGVPAK